MQQGTAPASIYYTPIDLRVESAGRLPYLLVTPKYRPMATLTCDLGEFMTAFFALFYCHAMLWSIGIRHGDISEANLMWDPEGRKPKLCDFDFCEALQIGVPQEESDGLEGLPTTGTWIFMADELLTWRAFDGLVERVYRHEVEAFVAVLVWMTCRYKHGRLRSNPDLEDWHHEDYGVVRHMKAKAFDDIRERRYCGPPDVPQSSWRFVRSAVNEMLGFRAGYGVLEAKLAILRDFPGHYAATTEMPEDFNDLRALHGKILSWPLFTHTSAQPFVNLMKECIPNPDRQQETKA